MAYRSLGNRQHKASGVHDSRVSNKIVKAGNPLSERNLEISVCRLPQITYIEPKLLQHNNPNGLLVYYMSAANVITTRSNSTKDLLCSNNGEAYIVVHKNPVGSSYYQFY